MLFFQILPFLLYWLFFLCAVVLEWRGRGGGRGSSVFTAGRIMRWSFFWIFKKIWVMAHCLLEVIFWEKTMCYLSAQSRYTSFVSPNKLLVSFFKNCPPPLLKILEAPLGGGSGQRTCPPPCTFTTLSGTVVSGYFAYSLWYTGIYLPSSRWIDCPNNTVSQDITWLL